MPAIDIRLSLCALCAVFVSLLPAVPVRAVHMSWEGHHGLILGPPVQQWITGEGATDGYDPGLPGWTGPRSFWAGRPIMGVDPDSGLPGVVEMQGPMPGDSLSFDGKYVDIFLNGHDAHMKEIFGATHTGMSDISFAIYATLTGGTFESDTRIGIGNQDQFVTDPLYPDEEHFLPFVMQGTHLSAPLVSIETLNYINLDSGTTITGGVVNIAGGQHGLYPLPVGEEAKVQLRLVSEVHASTLNVFQFNQTPFVFNVEEASVIDGLGMNIGSNVYTPNGMAEVRLQSDSEANFAQYIIVGNTGPGSLTLKSGAKVTSPNAYEVVGLDATGFMHVADHAEVRLDDLQVGVRAQGDVAIDTFGKVTTNKATVGAIVGMEGSVNIQDDGRWDTTDITVGDSGTGRIYVRQKGTLKINGEGILGKEVKGTGILNLIGSMAKLELGASGSLKIGDKGTGEVNLSQGATYTSQAVTQLGSADGGTGILTVDGQNSKWTATGGLKIGEHGTGRVEIRNKGNVAATGDTMIIGAESDGDGTLVIDGEGTTLDFDGKFIVADKGQGKLQLKNGATFTTGDLTLAKSAGSVGTLELTNVGSAAQGFVVEGDFTVGAAGRGIVRVEGGYGLTANSDVTMGETPTSGSQESPNLATITGHHSNWFIDGNLTLGKGAGSYATIDVLDKAHFLAEGALVTLGEAANSVGILNFDGASSEGNPLKSEIKSDLRIGVHGRGTMKVTGGSFVEVTDASLGIESQGHGEIEITGGDSIIKLLNDLSVGGLGTAKVDIKEQGGLEVDGRFGVRIDSKQSNGASMTISASPEPGLNSHLYTGRISIGIDGWGSLTVDGRRAFVGGLVSGLPEMKVAENAHSHGSVQVTQGGELHLRKLDAGIGGEAHLTVASMSEVEVGGDITLGSAAGSDSTTLTIDNSKTTAANFTAFANVTTTLSNSGKFFLKPGGRFAVRGNDANPAKLNIQGGAQLMVEGNDANSLLQVGALGKAIGNINSGGQVDIESIVVGGSGNNASTLSISGSNSFTNSAFLTVNKGATLTVADSGLAQVQIGAGINGTVDVLGGKMTIGAIGTPSTPGAVTVAGGTLIGSGKIKGNLIAKKGVFPDGHVTGARITPGNSPGTLTIEGNATLETGSVLEVEIGGLLPGTQYDQLVATGSITANGILDLAIVNSGNGFQLPGIGDQFTFLSAAGGVSTAFENVAALKSVAGGSLIGWSLSSNATSSVLQAVSITPLADGDYNGNGVVDSADYVVWRKGVGGINLAADGNRDGVIDNFDYSVWRSHFGGAIGSGEFEPDFGAVPEPSAALLCIAALAYGVSTAKRVRR